MDPTQAASIFKRLRDEPHLRDALERLLKSIELPRGVRLEVQGSIARGDVDAYSDIDVRFDGDRTGVAHVRRAFPNVLAGLGTVLSTFPATHLGLGALLVTFIEVDGRVIKVDADFSPEDASDAGETDAERLRDGDRKFVGWTWYAFAKIARGELFESADALDVMRTRALLPLLLHVMQLPATGYRYLERRLSQAAQAHLRATYPGALERDELLRALSAMTDYYHDLRQPDLSEARFERMRVLVRRGAAALAAARPAR